MKIGLQNFRILRNKLTILIKLLSDYRFDILCITESWLDVNEHFMCPTGYNLLSMTEVLVVVE